VHLVVIGLNHETAPIDLREKLRIPEAGLTAALCELKSLDEPGECLILSTCNRTEIYACTPNRAGDTAVRRWLESYCGVTSAEMEGHLYSRAGHKAAEHLFRVAAGIDSLVTGEAQILGQVRYAYTTASAGGFTGAVLNPLFQQAIAVGKRARTETEIGRGAFSVSSVAVQLAKSIFGELTGRTVLIVGASKMGELTITNLVGAGCASVLVTNRTYDRARDLACRFGGEALPFDELAPALGKADIVITATGAREPILTRSMVAAAMRARRGRPLFFVDIAVPRDIAAEVSTLDNVFVYNIDDLQQVVSADLDNRRAEIAGVESIVAEEVAAFTHWFRGLEAVPVITALRERFDDIRETEMAKLQGKLRHLSPEDMNAINAAARSIINKICHQPMISIKDYTNSEEATVKLETVCELFGLCPEDEEPEREEASIEIGQAHGH